jgi:hypothetical protein
VRQGRAACSRPSQEAVTGAASLGDEAPAAEAAGFEEAQPILGRFAAAPCLLSSRVSIVKGARR